MRTSTIAALVVAAALLAPAASSADLSVPVPHYVASHVPRGFHPFEVTSYEGLSSVWYAYRGDENSLLTVHTHTDGRCCYDTTTDQHPIRIRGHRGTIARLVDGSAVYGRTIYWEERPGVGVEVVDQSILSDRQLRNIAQHVVAASDGDWRRVSVATMVVPTEDALRGRPSKVLGRGVVAGHPWVFRALLPRGYPLFSWDRRVPCPELSYRGVTRLDRWDCEQFPTHWRLFGNQIWVYGALGSRNVRRVRVRDYYDPDDPGVVVKARTAMPGFKFYIAPMPRDTCEVFAEDADKPPRRGGIGPDGPFGSDPDAKRCAKAPTGPR
jgi:hypothetical protein